MKIIATSMGADPLHFGHVECLEMAKKLGDKLIVIVNTDEFLLRKKGFVFMPLQERMTIIAALRCVDEVIACIDKDQSVCETLRFLKAEKNISVFAKGGDKNSANIPETAICKQLGIEIVDGLGAKVQSSSDLVKKMREKTKF